MNSPEKIQFADGASLEKWREREPGVVVADPLFVNPDAGDFRLKPGSPAAQIGFVPFDLSAVGRVTKNARTAGLPKPPRAYPPAPPEPPIEIHEDFELLRPGQGMPGWQLMAANRDENVEVTAETGAGGSKQNLKFKDGPGGATYFPHLVQYLLHPSGVVRIAFDLRVEPGARPSFESRDNDPWYTTGMSLDVMEDGMLKSAGKDLLKVPFSEWLRIEMTGGVGPDSTGKYHLAVTLPGDAAPRVFDDLPYRKGFHTLGWVGFSAMTQKTNTFFVDNFVLERVKGK